MACEWRAINVHSTFQDLRPGHVGALPGQLVVVIGYLTWRPRSASAVMERLGFAWMGKPRPGQVVGAVARSWRAAELQSLPADAPVPAWCPGHRTGYSAPLSQSCGWYWLEAIAKWYYLGQPFYYRITEHDRGWWNEDSDTSSTSDIADIPYPRRLVQGRALASLQARLVELRTERPWGLDVGTASDIATGWLWQECQVLLAMHGKLYRTSRYGGAVELVPDMDTYHWLVGPGREREDIEFLDPLVGFRNCYGN